MSASIPRTADPRAWLGLIRFSHTVFALPFALLAAILAWEQVPFRGQDLVGILLCMVLARSAAMAFNRLVDRRIDAANPRTASRHLPAGELTPLAVTLFVLLCSAGFVAATFLFLPNRLPLYLSVPVLLFLLGYSLAKRFTIWCHYWLAAALMLSPIAAWIALTGRVDWPPVLLAGAVFFWVGGFDVIYSCQDAGFDSQNLLHSIPSRFGVARSLKLAALSHLLCLGFLVALWLFSSLSWIFLGGIVVVAGLLIHEHRLVRPDDLSRVNLAFFHVNAIISIGLAVVGAIDLWLL
ncbi:MAG: putative 4-hydroxybenzoate polyprenyltransferase [Planctomycetaceae bacterium]|nr:putative 4-hydroxybenzoate polyprenyltransferase [Planctomycetaceae bacterium]